MYTQTKHYDRYADFECDADAMAEARERMEKQGANSIYVYRHRDKNTAGIKDYVVSYNKEINFNK